VHTPTVVAVLLGLSLAFLLAVVGEWMKRGYLRAQWTSLFFLLLVVLPLLQLIPLPTALRGKIDPGGASLLSNGPDGTPRVWPFSLDPFSTEVEVGVAAAALVAFLLSAHDATRRRHRKPVLDAIALAGVVGLASGLVHRIFGFDRLYGIFDVYGAVFPGPFINPNHSAEFYELAAFAALALALAGNSESRIAWFAAAAANAAAALTTLSRGSLLALFAGGAIFVALRLRAIQADQTDEADGPRAGRVGRIVAWSLFGVACLASAAVALGASPVLDEVANTNLTSRTEKIVVWKDSWAMVLQHPLGIGRHAFDRVYPIYKTLTMNSRFVFVENGALQLLIDLGWPGMALLGAALAWLGWKLKQGWRGDHIDAALFAGLVAVGVHNLVDFGIETMGIRVPFAALAGVLVGRHAMVRSEAGHADATGRSFTRLTALAVAAMVFVGIGVGFHSALGVSADDIEAQWRRNPSSAERRQIALQGGRRFPTDFYFALLQSYDEPLRPPGGRGPSPRLMALNRALLLCPACSSVHQQVARALIALGLRGQALSSLRDAVRLSPTQTGNALVELDAAHFAPADMATLAVGDASQTLEVARFLVGKGAPAAREIEALIADAVGKGAPLAESLLIKAEMALAAGKNADARAALEEGRRSVPQDARFDEELSIVAEREGKLDEALNYARTATTMSPFSVPFARRRLALVQRLQRWAELEDALSLLKVALRQNGQNVTEVHKVAGDTLVSRGNLGRALSEYRTAATLAPTDPTTWAALGRVCEARGDLSGAAAAYHRQAALRPGDAEAQQAIARVEKERLDERIKQMLPPP
ncbi:MAG TPA: O-antigen ligase family protein, partial [Polyangia bacterium]|nr:O-antigen ligase family protein [Polyangia bacterium]